jgi:methionyl-tRNA synthetase
LVVHDYVTAGGRKIGKSLGNAVDPQHVRERFGTDALRWWLCREVPLVGEASFTEERLVDTANRDLANGVGNLVQRTITLAARAFGGEPVRTVATGDLAATCASARSQVDDALARYDLRSATGAIVALVDTANRYVDATRPWELLDQPVAARAALAPLVHATRTIAREIEPFVPDLASRVHARTGRDGEPVCPGPPVQPRLG